METCKTLKTPNYNLSLQGQDRPYRQDSRHRRDSHHRQDSHHSQEIQEARRKEGKVKMLALPKNVYSKYPNFRKIFMTN